ncbi:MAG: hypothetical protein OSB62_07355 [Alphaproteobacteria bacterium]|nr:hypothetical protein [Alphaproteobacteria bacterium]
MPIIMSVTLIGGYSWMVKPEVMNDQLIMISDADLNSIEPAMGPVEDIAEAVSTTLNVEEDSITDLH